MQSIAQHTLFNSRFSISSLYCRFGLLANEWASMATIVRLRRRELSYGVSSTNFPNHLNVDAYPSYALNRSHPVIIKHSFGSKHSVNKRLTSSSGQITKRISCCRQPLFSTPPPKNLLAKSTCSSPLSLPSIAPSSDTCNSVSSNVIVHSLQSGKSATAMDRRVNVTTPTGSAIRYKRNEWFDCKNLFNSFCSNSSKSTEQNRQNIIWHVLTLFVKSDSLF